MKSILILTLLCLSFTVFGQTILVPYAKPMAKRSVYIRTDGTVAFDAKYSNLLEFTEDGFALVYNSANKMWAFVDTSGVELEVPFKRWAPGNREIGSKGFHGGIARIIVKRKFGCINTKGEVVHDPVFNFISPFVDNIAIGKIDQEFFMLYKDKTHKKLDLPIRELRQFSEGRARFRSTNGLFGLIDTEGSVIVEPIYKSIGHFFDGVAWMKTENDLVGFIDVEGNVLIAPKFTSADNMDPVSKRVRVRVDHDLFYISRTGGKLQLKGATSFGNFEEGYAFIRARGLFGYINGEGEWLVSPTFSHAKPFKEGMAAVREGRLWGFINTKGELIIPAKFIDVRPFKNGYAAVSIGKEKWGIIGKDGKWLIKPMNGTLKDVSIIH